MQILEIAPLENGGHNNQTVSNVTPKTFPIPNGWCLVPEGMVLENFPFGTVTAEEINGVMTLTEWVAGEIPPEPPTPEPEPSEEEDLSAMVVDNELRLSMLEMGLEEL